MFGLCRLKYISCIVVYLSVVIGISVVMRNIPGWVCCWVLFDWRGGVVSRSCGS